MLSAFTAKGKDQFTKIFDIDKCDLNYIAFMLKNGVADCEREILVNKAMSLLSTLETQKEKKLFCRKIKNLKNSEGLQIYLAMLDIEFAKYLIKYSHILSDVDIIRIISHYEPNTDQLQTTVASRKYIGEVLSDFIISKNIIAAIYSILRNPSAIISGQSLCEIFFNNLDDIKLYEIILLRLLNDPKNLKYLLTASKDDILKNILEYIFAKNHTIQIYLPDDSSYQAFNFFLAKDHMQKLKQEIDQLFRIKALSPLRITKLLIQGDVYSFCYAISRMSDISYTKMKTIFCSEYSSITFAEILTKAGFNHDLRMAVIQLTEFIYISCLEEYLTNENFLELIKKQYTFFVSKYRWDTHKTIEYLFGISEGNN